jgi:hypothetical protein
MAACRRVLIVSDNFVGGGLENRILGQLDYYVSKNIKAYLACGVLSDEFSSCFEKVLKTDTLGWYDAPMGRILRQAQEIYDFCVENKIDHIECHPWNLLIPAVFAANRLKVPISLTLHGKTSTVEYGNLFLDSIQRYGFDEVNIVGEHIRKEAEEYFVNNDVKVVPNSIKIESQQEKIEGRPGHWACISRLDKIKSGLIADALKIMDDAGVIDDIEIFGKGDGESWLAEEVKKLKQNKVSLKGWTDNAVETLRKGNYCGFLGMGLSAMEAASLNIPVMVLGYDGPYLEALSAESFDKIKNNNFVGFGARQKKQVLQELEALASNKQNYRVSGLIKDKCSRESVWGNYYGRIDSLECKKKPTIDFVESFLKKAKDSNCSIYDQEQQFSLCEQGGEGYFGKDDLLLFMRAAAKWNDALREEKYSQRSTHKAA